MGASASSSLPEAGRSVFLSDGDQFGPPLSLKLLIRARPQEDESRSGFQVPVEARRICLVRATSASDGFEGIAHERLRACIGQRDSHAVRTELLVQIVLGSV
jgi:hypothetical protein